MTAEMFSFGFEFEMGDVTAVPLLALMVNVHPLWNFPVGRDPDLAMAENSSCRASLSTIPRFVSSVPECVDMSLPDFTGSPETTIIGFGSGKHEFHVVSAQDFRFSKCDSFPASTSTQWERSVSFFKRRSKRTMSVNELVRHPRHAFPLFAASRRKDYLVTAAAATKRKRPVSPFIRSLFVAVNVVKRLSLDVTVCLSRSISNVRLLAASTKAESVRVGHRFSFRLFGGSTLSRGAVTPWNHYTQLGGVTI